MQYLRGVARPSWMPQPPLGALLPDAPRRAQPRATLTSAAVTQPGSRWALSFPKYRSRLLELGKSAHGAGFHSTLLFDQYEAIQDDPIFQRFGGQALARNLSGGRPFCDAFKPVALWRALMRSREGDYVMWADASRYVTNASLSSSVRDAMRMLRGERRRGRAPQSWKFSQRWTTTSWYRERRSPRDGSDLGVGSAYGMVHCPVLSCEKELALYNWRRAVISADTMLAYADLVGGDDAPLDAGGAAFAEDRIKNERPGRYFQLRDAPARLWHFLNRTHILASNLLLENTRANRLLVFDWLAMAAARPRGFCKSHTEDQAAFTMLAQNRSLPLLNPCVYLTHITAYEQCYTHCKRANNWLGLVADGRYEVVRGDEYEKVLTGGHDWQAVPVQRGGEISVGR